MDKNSKFTDLANNETAKATKLFVKASAEIAKTIAGLEVYADTVEALNEEINEKQVVLAGINEEFDTKFRQASIDFGLRIQENEDEVVTKVLENRGFTTISADDLDDLRSKAYTEEATAKSNIDTAVKIAVNGANSKHATEVQTLTSEHLVANAETTANLKALQEKVEFLTKSLETADKTLTSEREARVTMAANTSQPVINIDTKK